jgi:aspartyl protease family protein
MKKQFYFLIYIFVFGCNHPESNEFNRDKQTANRERNTSDINADNRNKSNRLEMELENGVRYIWIEVNGIKLRFIFDTGASSICLSPSEATVLYRQGTLQKEDIISSQYFQDATGRISEGTKINLKKIKVGNAELYNVEATVINSTNAPLLLGQSVLERFGSIEIDNTNNVIIFK